MFEFSGKNAIYASEAKAAVGEYNLIDTVQTGLQPNNTESSIDYSHAGQDPMIRYIVNNGVARSAEIYADPCKSGRDKWYIQTPFVFNDTPLGANDDGQGCCINLNDLQACRYKLDLHELCVKDCVATSMDMMMEDAVRIKRTDTPTPFTRVGDSLRDVRMRAFAILSNRAIERNLILGMPNYSGNGLRPFNGVISRLLDKRVMVLDGSAGVLSSIMALECRLNALGGRVSDFVAFINPVLMPSLRQEVATYLKTSPLTDWQLTPNGVSYNGLRIVESRFVDVDLTANTTSIWLIDLTKVGVKTVRPMNDPLVMIKDSEDDCGGRCITVHNAGTTVVTDWSGLALVKNVRLSAICNNVALTGLNQYVNSATLGHLFPKAETVPTI